MLAMKDPSGAAFAIGRLGGWEPLGFEAGDNNWYRFVANGPTTSVDPLGLADGLECNQFQRKLNIKTKPHSLGPSVGLKGTVRVKGEIDFLGSSCKECCPDGSLGEKTTQQIRGRLGIGVEFVLGGSDSFDWGGGSVSFYWGIKGEAWAYSSVSVAFETSTCASSSENNKDIRLCGVTDLRVRLYGGANARFQYGSAWSWEVGAQVYGEGFYHGLGWCVILDANGGFKSFETNRPGTWQASGFFTEVCFGGCVTWQLA